MIKPTLIVSFCIALFSSLQLSTSVPVWPKETAIALKDTITDLWFENQKKTEDERNNTIFKTIQQIPGVLKTLGITKEQLHKIILKEAEQIKKAETEKHILILKRLINDEIHKNPTFSKTAFSASILNNFKARFPEILTDEEIFSIVDKLIDKSQSLLNLFKSLTWDHQTSIPFGGTQESVLIAQNRKELSHLTVPQQRSLINQVNMIIKKMDDELLDPKGYWRTHTNHTDYQQKQYNKEKYLDRTAEILSEKLDVPYCIIHSFIREEENVDRPYQSSINVNDFRNDQIIKRPTLHSQAINNNPN